MNHIIYDWYNLKSYNKILKYIKKENYAIEKHKGICYDVIGMEIIHFYADMIIHKLLQDIR